MELYSMKKLMETAKERRYAIPSLCVWDSATVNSALKAAYEMHSPIILMHGPGEMALLPFSSIYASVMEALPRYPVPATLHLDHGFSMEHVKDSISAGFNSVMLDCSKKPFNENVSNMKKAVLLAKPKDICVEGELGAVGRVDKMTVEGSNKSTLTDPDEAVDFVNLTGVDLLAVSIGNGHGMYTKLPKFDFKRLAEINKRVGIPLVLHGGSGTKKEYIKKSIQNGICKINVASELIMAIRKSLSTQWKSGKLVWLPQEIAAAAIEYEKVAKKWIAVCGSKGKA